MCSAESKKKQTLFLSIHILLNYLGSGCKDSSLQMYKRKISFLKYIYYELVHTSQYSPLVVEVVVASRSALKSEKLQFWIGPQKG